LGGRLGNLRPTKKMFLKNKIPSLKRGFLNYSF